MNILYLNFVDKFTFFFFKLDGLPENFFGLSFKDFNWLSLRINIILRFINETLFFSIKQIRKKSFFLNSCIVYIDFDKRIFVLWIRNVFFIRSIST